VETVSIIALFNVYCSYSILQRSCILSVKTICLMMVFDGK